MTSARRTLARLLTFRPSSDELPPQPKRIEIEDRKIRFADAQKILALPGLTCLYLPRPAVLAPGGAGDILKNHVSISEIFVNW
jgi:hypothetical protein